MNIDKDHNPNIYKSHKLNICCNIFLSLAMCFSIALIATFVLRMRQMKMMPVAVGLLFGSILFITALFIIRLEIKKKFLGCYFLICFFILIFGIELLLPIDPLIKIPYIQPLFVDKKFFKFADRRSIYQYVKSQREMGRDLYYSMDPAEYLRRPDLMKKYFVVNGKAIFPLSPLSNSDTVTDSENGEWHFVVTDEHGFNNRKGFYKSGKLDIAFIGDSFTWGAGVGQEDNIVAVVRKKYPKTINLGVCGMGPLEELAVLKEYAQVLKPKLVIWVYYIGNDMYDLGQEEQVPQLKVYLDPSYSQGLYYIQPQIHNAVKKWFEGRIQERPKPTKENISSKDLVEEIRKTFLLARIRVLLGIQFSKKEYVIPCPPLCGYLSSCEYDPLFKQILKEAKMMVESWGGKMILVSIPYYSTVLSVKNDKNYNYEPHRDGQLPMVESLGIPLIDTQYALMAQPDIESLKPYKMERGHFNKAGYEVIGKAILKEISKYIK